MSGFEIRHVASALGGVALVIFARNAAAQAPPATDTLGSSGGDRPAPGEVRATSLFTSSADLGLWARAPAFVSGKNVPLLLAGGDVGLASWLTLRLYGADDFMLHRFSGMSAGLQTWLLPQSSPIQLTASAGWVETTTPGAPGVWGELGATGAFGLFRVGASVRTQVDLATASNVPGFTSTLAVSYGNLVKIGLAWVTESGPPGTPLKQALVPSVSATTKGGGVSFGASTTLGVSGAAPTVPLTLRLGGRF